jgi:hypothetical protein
MVGLTPILKYQWFGYDVIRILNCTNQLGSTAMRCIMESKRWEK